MSEYHSFIHPFIVVLPKEEIGGTVSEPEKFP